MAFTEFFCRSGGSNLNGGGIAAGTEPGTAAAYTSTNGNWNGSTTFTPTDGSTPASSVSVGDFASVYNDGASVAVYIARVTAVAAGANGAITLSGAAKSGTAPTNSATARSIKVGGAWKGPNAAESFPFGLVDGSLVNAAGNGPRVNLKNDATYSVTATVTHNKAGPQRWEGFTTTAGDGGRANIDGGTSGVSYLLFDNAAASQQAYVNLIFSNNGATGSADGVNASLNGNSRTMWKGCVFHHFRGSGLDFTAASYNIVVECEAYACNANNSASKGGFVDSGSTNTTEFIRCIAHDNTGSNAYGFLGILRCKYCISSGNGIGFGNLSNGTIGPILVNCEAYNNAGDGVTPGGSGGICSVYIENCNFVKNGGYGINLGSGMSSVGGFIINCGFGVGTQANTSGDTNIAAAYPVAVSGSVSYGTGLTPWVDPANGDFRISLAAAKGTGRGTFTETAASYAGAVAYPDIGAAQHQDSGGAAGMLFIPNLEGV